MQANAKPNSMISATTPDMHRKKAKPTPKDSASTFSYSQFVLEKSQEEGLRKGARTELRIRWAACELLEKSTLDALKVQDICAHLEIAQGTLYQYFPDRDTLLEKLLQDFVAFLTEKMSAVSPSHTAHEESVRLSTATYSRLFEQNRGMMKCLLNHYEAFPKARGILQAFNRTWIETVVKAVKRRRRASGSGQKTVGAELLRRAYALGGMVDQYLASLYLYGDENIVATAGKLDDVVNTLTFIWIQTFKDQFETTAPLKPLAAPAPSLAFGH